MKKHLIAVAVATAVAAPAMAQNVSISGLLDAGYAQAKANLDTQSNKSSSTGAGSGWSTSNITFTATEDLGGGLKASAVISSFFESGSGSPAGAGQSTWTSYNTIGGRDRFLKLDGSFGSVQLGRFTPAINGYCSYSCAGGTNNTAGTTDSGNSDLIQGTLGGRVTYAAPALTGATAYGATSSTQMTIAQYYAHMEHQSNILEYTTPSISGFNATLTYVNAKADNASEITDDSAKQTGIRVNYAAGPLALSFADGKRKTKTEGTAGNQDAAESKVKWFGASYDVGAVKIFLAHGNREDKFQDGAAAESTLSDVKVNSVGVQIPLGAITLNASMYDGEDKMTSLSTDDRDLKGYQASIRYALSKRTFVYAVTGQNKDSLSSGTSTNNWKNSETKLGMVHSF